MFGVSRLDAWATIVNARLSPREIDAIRGHCRPRRTIYLNEVSPDALAHADRHSRVEGSGERVDMGSMGDALLGARNEDCEPEPDADTATGQVAALVYTSGTTANPKGVMLTHRNLLYIAKVSSTLRALRAGDRVYGVLPISHVYGLASVTLGTLFAGASLQLEARFSPQSMLKAITRCGVTVLQGVPAMYAKLLESLPPTTAPLDVPQLRMCFAGGSPLDPALKSQAERVLGVTLHNGYGLTEASPTVAHTRLAAPRSDCAVGPPLPGVEIRISSSAGGDIAAGEPGTLHVRGPNVMRGYYRNPQLTAETFDAEGWLDTGDIARQDASGALFIVGRAKDSSSAPDSMSSGGGRGGTERAPVGRPLGGRRSRRAGNEEVVAFVELAPGKLTTPAELDCMSRASCTDQAAREIVIVASLPVAANGKILKHRLAELAQHAAASIDSRL